MVVAIDLAAGRVVDAIDAGSINCHRLALLPGGSKLYTENEEDASISVILLAERRLARRIAMPGPVAGIAAAPDGRLVVAVHDEAPLLDADLRGQTTIQVGKGPWTRNSIEFRSSKR